MPNSIGNFLQELVVFEWRKRLLCSQARICPPGQRNMCMSTEHER
jgi:hypothetical protein